MSGSRFEFATAGRIVFGPGVVREAVAAARAFGRRALLVTGRNPTRSAALAEDLAAAGVAVTRFAVAGEPEIAAVAEAAARARTAGCDLVIGFGGGSALDAGKAAAAMATNEGEILDYLEIVGRGRALERPPLPCIAIPTTAGTGAEATRNAVLSAPARKLKVSLRSLWMLPRLALVDPLLTHPLPPALTASTGFDALAQLVESYVSCRANPATDGLCAEGLRRAGRSLGAACRQGGSAAPREDMALASLFGGMALANAGLGAVHGFAAPIGGRFAAPHGAICAALLAPAMAINLRAAESRDPGGATPSRFREIARLLTGRAGAQADDGIRWVRDLAAELKIPGLAGHGVAEADLPELAEQAARTSSMKGNPLPLTPEEHLEIARSAWRGAEGANS